jgi:hypothetical protein
VLRSNGLWTLSAWLLESEEMASAEGGMRRSESEGLSPLF